MPNPTPENPVSNKTKDPFNDDVGILDIDCFRQSRKVRLKLEDGTSAVYVLREMTTPDKERWMEEMTGRMQVGADGKPARITRYSGLQASLISKCLFTEDDKPVGLEFIMRNIHSVAQDKVYKLCEELNAISVAGQEKAKND